MPPKPNRTTIQFLIDTHFTPSSPETFSNFSAEKVVDGLLKMGIESVMYQAKCFRGFGYYDSKILQRHPQLRGDIMTPLVRLAKQAGLEVFLYTCTAGDFYCWENYPAMWMLDQNGNQCGSGVVCTNGPYRQRYLTVLLEMGRKFPLDGIFVDGPDPAFQTGSVWPSPCYCRACQALWQERYGEKMPLSVQKVARRQLVDFLDANCDDFIEQVIGAIRTHRPEARVWHNTSRPTRAQDEAYHEVDAYHRNFYRPSLFMKRHRAACGDLPRVYSLTMDKPVRHAQSPAMIAWELATYLAHKPAEVTVWSTPDLPTMWYSPAMVRKARWAVDQVKPLRDEMDQQMSVIADIAIGHSRSDILLGMETCPEHHCRDDLSGAHRLLSEAQIPFDYVDLDQPLKLAGVPVLMLNDIQALPDKQVRAILAWVKKGGNLLVTGRGCVVDALPDLAFGDKVTVADTSTFAGRTPVAYVRADWRPGGDEWSIARGYWPVLSHRGWKPLAHVLPQAVYRRGWEFDQSHRPSEKPVSPAALYRRIGRGQVIYFNHMPFAESLDRGANLFRDIPAACLAQFGLAPRFEVHGCQSIEANYYRTPTGIAVVLVNGFVGKPVVANGEPAPFAEMNEVVTVADITITSRRPVTRATSGILGDLERTKNADGSTTIHLPKLGLWDVVRLA